MSDSRTAIWIDAQGVTRLTRLLLDTTVAQATLQTALLAASNAVVQSYSEGPVVFPGLLPVTGVYQSVLDIATLSFKCADGTIAQITLPAPVSAIFMVDGETVDAAFIPGIISAAVGHLTSTSGSLAATFQGGVRVPRRGG